MCQHYIQYIKRTLIGNQSRESAMQPVYIESQSPESGFWSPEFHATGSQQWPANEVKQGGTIWLVSELSSKWGRLPPSLDAQIRVGEVALVKEAGGRSKLRFAAQDTSQWFPLWDATETLSQLEVVQKRGEITTPYDPDKSSLGQVFQSMRKVHNPSVLEGLASVLNTRRYEFVSYRIADGMQAAFNLVKERVDSKNCVFWDRWCLPRRLVERREDVSNEALDQYLLTKIDASKLVWGVESERYDEPGSYSSREKEHAEELNKYRSYPV